MEMWTIISSIVIAVLTCSTAMGFIFYRKSERRRHDAEALKAEAEARGAEISIYERQQQMDAQRNDQLHAALKESNETIREQAQTIKGLNHTIDDTKARIREVGDRLVVTERENTRLAEENGELKADRANHRCVIRKCGGREPANEHTAAALESGTAVFPARPSAVRKKKPAKGKAAAKAEKEAEATEAQGQTGESRAHHGAPLRGEAITNKAGAITGKGAPLQEAEITEPGKEAQA